MTERFPFLAHAFFNNTVLDYLLAACTFILGSVVVLLFGILISSSVKKWAKATSTWIDDFLVAAIERLVMPMLYTAVFYFSAKVLTLNPGIDKLVTVILIAVVVFQSTRLLLAVVLKFIQEVWIKKAESPGSAGTAKTIGTVVSVVVWGVAVVFFLDNLGFDVSAVVAGLGIGGVAVALAAQNILGDLFNYFVIFFDRPFEEGDFVILGDYMGVIENVGIKTTRIRSLGGEQIVLSNTDLTTSRLRNYKRMRQRRVLFRLGVVYQTTHEQTEKIPGMIKAVVEGVENTRFDRAHFQAFGDFSLNFEVVYYVLSADYNQYMDIQEKINLGIQKAFAAEGIEFAYPTQTLFVSK
ncbi:mechanosensitive ion channel family protein [Omnitrophica bacterium]|nr:mechanosensitive ion channel family protein [Candidatus Omnitrophota bacterium]